MTASRIEFADEFPLLADVFVVLPLVRLGVPEPAVDGEAVDESVGSVLKEEGLSLLILRNNNLSSSQI